MTEKSIIEQIIKSPLPKEAAESFWDTLQKYGDKKGLKLRMKEMTTAGIVSEVTDLIEALEMKQEDALPYLITAYENQAESSLHLARLHEKEGRNDLVIEDTDDAKKSRLHANELREGKITVEEEIKARIEQRKDREIPPDNYYTTLLKLSNSLIPKEKQRTLHLLPTDSNSVILSKHKAWGLLGFSKSQNYLIYANITNSCSSGFL